MSKKFKITALGCRTNQYEAQAFTDQLKSMGYEPAMDGEEADLCIVNTCTVTSSADSSSRHEIRKLGAQNPNAPIYVTGCYAERDREAVAALPSVAGVISNKDKEFLLKEIFPDIESLPEFSIERFEAHTRAFVKVQDGCNSYCTYCIIPYVRGRSRSKNTSEILSEVRTLISNGYKEIVLTGINIGDFDGNEEKTSLAELTVLVDQVKGVDRVRISSIDPDEVDDALLDAVIDGKNTCQSMHIVLQSGSNVVLKRMNRKYTRQMFLDTCERLRSANPNFTFTTDVIVGFPGETEEDHKETLKIIEEVRFAKVHMFPYSDRPRTRANLYPNKVENKVKARRKQEVLRLSERIAFEIREDYIGKEMWVLTESRESETEILGHTDNFLSVRIQSKTLEPNMLVKVNLKENSPTGLLGYEN